MSTRELFEFDATESLESVILRFRRECRRAGLTDAEECAGEDFIRSVYQNIATAAERRIDVHFDKTIGQGPRRLRIVAAVRGKSSRYRTWLTRLFRRI